jgi:cyclic pyranopterin monophosphate synthase
MGLSHIDDKGALRMVDVGEKQPTRRVAIAEGWFICGTDVMNALRSGETPKGNVYEAARVAGIMAAKRTSDLIPLCHPLPIDHIRVDFEPGEDRVRIQAEVSTHSNTGVEMEALTAVSVAGLTLYDMLKAISHEMRIKGVRLLKKSGGKSGEFHTSETGSNE